MRERIIKFLNHCDIKPNEELVDEFHSFVSELRSESFEKGFIAGVQDDYDEGYTDGYEDGYSNGKFDTFSGEILDD